MFEKVYIRLNTHSLTRSQQQSTITQMSHEHPVFEGQISGQKNAK